MRRIAFASIPVLLMLGCADTTPTPETQDQQMMPASGYRDQPGGQAMSPDPARQGSTDPAMQGSTDPAMQGTTPGSMAQGMTTGQTCPAKLDGITITTNQVEGGYAIEFTTTDVSKRDQLKQSVRELASRLEKAGGTGYGGGTQGSSMEGLPELTATVSDTADGARLALTPKEAKNLAPLRAQMRLEALGMRQHGHCPVMRQTTPDHFGAD